VRAYVTGASGFVGSWLAAHLTEAGDILVGGSGEVDVTDPAAIAAAITDAAPEAVYHLAALAHVGRSWEEPARTFEVNAIGTVNVLAAASACSPMPVVVVVSSAEVYGLPDGSAPVTETAPLRPVNPYAASKVAAEFAGLQAFLGRGVPVVRVRPFNHFGPGQSPDFVVSALARRIAEAERAGGGTVTVGNLSASRDFTDVRDVVRAYRLVAGGGVPGEVYNVASGRAVAIDDLVRRLAAMATETVELVEDPQLFRPVDAPLLVGDATTLRSATGWEPVIPFEETLGAVLDFWRKELAYR
jgi:GDP-4-dehydro-6-deoxy-D-mannose reductase